MTYQVSAESLVRDGVRGIAQETIETIPDKAKKIRQKKVDPENDSLLFDDSHSQNDGIPKIDIVSPKESNDSGKNAEPHVIDVFNIESIASGIDSDPGIAKAKEEYKQKVAEIDKKYKSLVDNIPSDLSQEERVFEFLEYEGKKNNEIAEADETLCRAYWDVMLPINDPKSKNIKKADKLWRNSYDSTDKGVYAQGAKEGLRFVARVCDNFGFEMRELGDLVFNKKYGDKSCYNEVLNEIQFDKRIISKVGMEQQEQPFMNSDTQ